MRTRCTSFACFGVALLAGACASSVGSVNDAAILAQSEADRAAHAPDPVAFHAPHKTEYRIGPRDLLELDVYELEEPNQTKRLRVRVSQDGRIVIPLIGSIVAGGRTSAELQCEIEKRLGADYLVNPSASVLVVEYQARTVTVLGAVAKAGTFSLRENSTTLLDALARAGGISEEAGSNVVVLRAGGAATAELDRGGGTVREASSGGAAARVLRIDLAELIEHGDMSANCMLDDGDVVHVPLADQFFVTGKVKKAGSFPLKEKMTVLKAIAMAGGLEPTATPSSTVLLRRTAEGRVPIPVDLTEVEAGSDGDLPLQAGDVVVVAESGNDRFLRSVGEFFKGLLHVGYNLQ